MGLIVLEFSVIFIDISESGHKDEHTADTDGCAFWQGSMRQNVQ